MSTPIREYLTRETWTLKEAAWLLADEDPGSLSFLYAPAETGRASHTYNNLKDATDMGRLLYHEARTNQIADRRVRPWDAIQWARTRGDQVPQWLDAIVEPKPEPKTAEKAPAERPLATTERNSLLTIIAALCDYSAIDPAARGAAKQIADLTDGIGAPVTDDTVRKALLAIPDAVASRKR